jgi:alkanesulfonate monooxygenase SsuD/methylene tetrahydromethanopterin reductase-like flavin-dependent oxidoreductase (luciferase family)
VRIGVALSPNGDWPAIVAAAGLADELGLDSVGLWDHYHSERPEWAYVAGWSAHAALAAATTRVGIVPMVLCNLNHRLGQLAKETSTLAIVSGGRFELAIGAGDYPVEYRAWHEPFPDAVTRLELLEETVAALRELWTGGPVTMAGRHVRLTDAVSTPAPPLPPRVVVGVGSSRRMIASAAAYADELNVYADEAILAHARERLARLGRDVPVSMYLHIEWGAWPVDLVDVLGRWRDRGVARVTLSIGLERDMDARIRELADASRQLTPATT